MNQSENINELATALAKCQGEMEAAIKDSINPHFKSKFATLYSIWESCRKPLSNHGLSVVQTMSYLEDKLCLTTKLMHSSGQWLSSVTPVISARNDAQGIGSALSYFKRYSLSALLGICTRDEDDDAEAAMPKDRPEKKPEKKVEKPKDEFISKQQAEELSSILDDCDPNYVKNIWDALNHLDKPIFSLNELSLKTFEKFKNGALKNREDYQSKMRGVA